MFYAAMIVAAVAECLAEENEFQESIRCLPDHLKQEMIAARNERRAAEKAERERQELLEAIRPRTLWFYLGLSNK
jgi:hypothetical protein